MTYLKTNINREHLREVIETDRGRNWWKPNLFKQKTLPLLPPELEIISPPPTQEENFNCFVFIFGLQYDRDFLGGKNPVQQEFIKYLILNKKLIPVQTPLAGDLIFYKNEQKEITHGGLMKGGDEVVSKWMWGPTIRHKIWDVPSSFGDEVLFFRSLSTDTAKRIYLQYKATGVYIEPIGGSQ